MNKFFLKLFNKNKYQKIKSELQQAENHNFYNKQVIPQLDKISEVIKTKKEISFLHSGHLGDIINSLPLIKEISKNSRCVFYIEVKKQKPKEVSNDGHPFGDYYLSDNAVSKLIPLLKNQKYISSVQVYNNEKVDINLNLFREWPINFNIDSVRWYFHITGVHADLTNPYIEVDKHKTITNRIVIMRSLRRQNNMISYAFLNKFENPLFVGLKSEYDNLKTVITNLEYFECKDFLELASIVKSSKVFIGNLSFGYALAESIKVKRLLESGANFPLVYPNGENAYDFYFQKHFEELFLKLYSN
jgi:hypothetical protein